MWDSLFIMLCLKVSKDMSKNVEEQEETNKKLNVYYTMTTEIEKGTIFLLWLIKIIRRIEKMKIYMLCTQFCNIAKSLMYVEDNFKWIF